MINTVAALHLRPSYRNKILEFEGKGVGSGQPSSQTVSTPLLSLESLIFVIAEPNQKPQIHSRTKQTLGMFTNVMDERFLSEHVFCSYVEFKLA